MADNGQVWLVGAGIASLSAAVFLIRDGKYSGGQLHIIEQADVAGGSLDGQGSVAAGYLTRGGRMFEPHFECTMDLLGSIPAAPDSTVTVRDRILAFNQQLVPNSHCRLVKHRRRIEAPTLGLATRDLLRLSQLFITPERHLYDADIASWFRTAFFETNFWTMWSSMFAFHPWHSVIEFRRYMKRFIHLMPGFNRLQGVLRTPLNQYESVILPIQHWLTEQGVDFLPGETVTDVGFNQAMDPTRITDLEVNGRRAHITIGTQDHVLITLGSMTADTTVGDHHTAPLRLDASSSGSWPLWQKIAAHSNNFGRPEVFSSDVDGSRFTSFTVTLRDKTFFNWMHDFSGNEHGTGGIVTLADSSWLISIFLPKQPHFSNQSDDVQVFWGYGLLSGRQGDYINKPMVDCSGAEVLKELSYHLGTLERHEELFGTASAVPCLMPYITSQFLPRAAGDRPNITPKGAENFAFIGQYCEQPRDCVFTVEYSVRSAQTAAARLSGLNIGPGPVYRGDLHPVVLWRATRALLN
jgi:oleate hydratase